MRTKTTSIITATIIVGLIIVVIVAVPFDKLLIASAILLAAVGLGAGLGASEVLRATTPTAHPGDTITTEYIVYSIPAPPYVWSSTFVWVTP